MNIEIISDIFGISGTVLVIIAYFAVISEKWSPKSLLFSTMNLLGASLLLVSLCINFNLGSFIIELFWIFISVYGIIRHFSEKRGRETSTPILPKRELY